MSARKAKVRMGRPPLPAGEVRASTFSIRILPTERAAIERAAEREEISASEWARRVLVNAARAVDAP